MTAQDNAVRVETDLIGPVEVPADALYGVHTVRALDAYSLHGELLAEYPEFLSAYAAVKRACAIANQQFGLLDQPVADAIVSAADELAGGQWLDQFPIRALQGGGGVSTNMNVNEVLANRAEELLGGTRGSHALVHPNDHVNRSQSTNDTYPTAVAVSTVVLVYRTVVDLRGLADTFTAKADEYNGVARLGRTCLRDALPLGVDETHRAHAAVVNRAADRLVTAASALLAVPLGATAVGTGAGAPLGFGDRAVKILAESMGLPLCPAGDYFDALSNLDPLLDVAQAVASAGLVIAKIAADLRLLSSGPEAGINEVSLPLISAGSSIMPGKVNPAIPELVMQVAMELRGKAHTVELAVGMGELELNVMEPVVLTSLHPATVKLGGVARVFSDLCVRDLKWNTAVLERNLAGSFLERIEESERAGYSATTY